MLILPARNKNMIRSIILPHIQGELYWLIQLFHLQSFKESIGSTYETDISTEQTSENIWGKFKIVPLSMSPRNDSTLWKVVLPKLNVSKHFFILISFHSF